MADHLIKRNGYACIWVYANRKLCLKRFHKPYEDIKWFQCI